MSESQEHCFTVRMDDLTWYKMEMWHKRDGVSGNDFVLRAINFYVDYLEGQENSVLPPAIQSAIDGRPGTYKKRMGRIKCGFAKI